jgi:hypothetical protein
VQASRLAKNAENVDTSHTRGTRLARLGCHCRLVDGDGELDSAAESSLRRQRLRRAAAADIDGLGELQRELPGRETQAETDADDLVLLSLSLSLSSSGR